MAEGVLQYLQPLEHNVYLLVGQRFQLALMLRQWRDQQALNSHQKFLPHPGHHLLFRRVRQVRV